MNINSRKLNLNLIKVVIVSSTFFFEKDVKIRKDTFISLPFLLLSNKNICFAYYSYFHKIQRIF